VRCLACHYSLKNLTEHRCPECGRTFDPNDPRTYESAPERRPPRIRNGLMLLVLAFVLAQLAIGSLPVPPSLVHESLGARFMRIAPSASIISVVVVLVFWMPRYFIWRYNVRGG